VNILIENTQTDVSISHRSIENLLHALTAFQKIKTDEVSVALVTEVEISSLHSEYFNDPTPTDCITFPIDPPGALESFHCLGEIIICPKIAILHSSDYQTNLYEELSLYIIHGFLHLLGFEDHTPVKTTKMRSEETRCFEWIKEENLLLQNR